MEEKVSDKILAFDTLFTTNTIQMLKVLITHLAPSVQRSFAVYIKLMELQYTLSFIQRHPDASLGNLSYGKSSDTATLFEEILPFCDDAQKGKILQMKNMFQTFENMQEMMEMMQMMKEFFPTDADNPSGNMDFMSALSGMSGMPDLSGIDLSQIMGMFSSANMNNDI